jgi:hypothetical protein
MEIICTRSPRGTSINLVCREDPDLAMYPDRVVFRVIEGPPHLVNRKTTITLNSHTVEELTQGESAIDGFGWEWKLHTRPPVEF